MHFDCTPEVWVEHLRERETRLLGGLTAIAYCQLKRNPIQTNTTSNMPETLSIAVCICQGVTLSDFIPNMEILGGLNNADHPVLGKGMGDVPYRLKFEYLSPTMDPVVSIQGDCMPTVNPTTTYDAAMASGKQYDIIWVPAGPIPDFESGNNKLPEGLIPFIVRQAPKAKYVMSVCGGSAYLAFAGLLSGKKATTNKAFYRAIVGATPKDIQWVPKARWVVDGNVWTSSGVTAGCDMALAFTEHLAGPRAARHLRGAVELREATMEDDPFAEFHGLV
ncbi:Class I glutamine amidotransferase-like protein [Mycena sanguinolenta]|uniref:Class I glutamine amidotransferase-like protein n=1 Tax=Mycena sanguinolenta TaxID=230812 RepID=A0A8H7D520_9AGAR|nr:Class I glutamine amidotransferase-like protein [Mycena sanguinolenta]